MYDLREIKYFINSIGSCFFVCSYSANENQDDDLDITSDYKESGPIYNELYNAVLKDIGHTFNKNLNDVEWVMLLKNGDFKVEKNIIELNVDNKVEFFSLVDCSLIFQSVTHIKEFFTKLNLKENLTRFEQYQISVYVNSISSISRPSSFLVNAHEIELYEQIYNAWDLEKNIDVVDKICDKSVQMFKFLSDYKKSNSKEMVNSLLAFVSFLLSYEQVLDLFFSSMGIDPNIKERVSVLLFTLAISITLYKISKNAYKTILENNTFKQKTK